MGAATLLVGAVGAGRMLVEARQEARGRRPPTWAATRLVGADGSGGRLAEAMAQPRAAAPRGWRRALAIAWASPTTVVGLLLATVGAGRWRWSEEAGALVVSGARSPVLRLGGMAAQGVGHVIISQRDPVPPLLLAHEAAHVRQAELLGPATLPLYFWWLARHGYRRHPMERGARATARRAAG